METAAYQIHLTSWTGLADHAMDNELFIGKTTVGRSLDEKDTGYGWLKLIKWRIWEKKSIHFSRWLWECKPQCVSLCPQNSELQFPIPFLLFFLCFLVTWSMTKIGRLFTSNSPTAQLQIQRPNRKKVPVTTKLLSHSFNNSSHRLPLCSPCSARPEWH